MGIALVIVGGLCFMTLVAGVFDFMSKRKKALDKGMEEKFVRLEQKLELLELKVAEKDERVGQLESDISFYAKLIEDKTKK